ncbi:MAG TPA: bifunctional 5,10-methylenetetrahydrofolate dehydrogenase/5,10-methenyltetrahydrofolate cyclohydrolase [Candidatus Paceibacterota bacterium]
MIVDGNNIASDILRSVRAELGEQEPVVRAVVMAPTAVTESYLRIKTEKAREAGMRLELVRIESEASKEEIIHKIGLPGADAVIVQLPLPANIDEQSVLNAIPLEKDADALSSLAYGRFLNNEKGALLPPVACAVAEILSRAGVQVAGKRTVVVGNGKLVGAPVAAWLAREGADVIILTQGTFENKKAFLKDAELVVSGAGSPHFITPDLLQKGVLLIDAGTSESDGAIVGDFDPACAEIASLYTPVPGGVGPIAVACLFKNVAELIGNKGLQYP